MGNEMEFKYVHKGDQLVFNNYYSIPEDPLLLHKSVKNGQLKKRASYGRIDIYLQLP